MHKLKQTSENRNMEGQEQHLPQGSTILGGRYRLLQLLYQRPRLNLYLGQRISSPQLGGRDNTYRGKEQGPVVAIRELVLTNLPFHVRKQIEQAAHQEFVSPMALSFPRLVNPGDRLFIEGERHYLVMQLSETRTERYSTPITLAELLRQPEWPSWLDTTMALTWGVQLCRIVARLHRRGVISGDLDPNTVLVDGKGVAAWSPVLLASWPPPTQFWPVSATVSSKTEQCDQIFPIAMKTTNNAFVAPEVIQGGCDERSDVYSLGALLYLLCTHYAPAAAMRRGYAELVGAYVGCQGTGSANDARSYGSDPLYSSEGLALIPPRLLNRELPPALEDVLLRALAFDPSERYPSAFALAEALENL